MSGPLAGRTVLVTRPTEEAGELADLLEARGARALVRPAIAYLPPLDERPLAEALGRISGFAWIALTSARAVKSLESPGIKNLSHPRIAVVGPQTARAVEELGLRVALEAPEADARSLAAALLAALGPGERVLYLRAERVSVDLTAILRAAGAEVEEAIAYRTARPPEGLPGVEAALRLGEIDWITAFSGSALHNLYEALSEPDLLQRARLATLGPSTSREAGRLGLTVHAQAATPDAPAMVEAIIQAEGFQ